MGQLTSTSFQDEFHRLFGFAGRVRESTSAEQSCEVSVTESVTVRIYVTFKQQHVLPVRIF